MAGPSFLIGTPTAQMRRNRRKDIAAMEGLADWLQEVSLVFQGVNGFDLLFGQRRGKHAIVRANEEVVCGLDSNGLAPAADAWVNDRHVNGAFREEPMAGGQGEGPTANVASGNLVRDVHHRGPWLDAQNDTFHRADEPVAGAEICG